MAEIQFERRGRPLWLVLLILLVVVGGAYFAWTSCATLQRQGALRPTTAPAVAPGTPGPSPNATTAPRP